VLDFKWFRLVSMSSELVQPVAHQRRRRAFRLYRASVSGRC
jgi:hypothetical protein